MFVIERPDLLNRALFGCETVVVWPTYLACWIDRNTPVVRAFFQTAVPQMILGIEKEETNERQSGGVNKQIFLIFFCDKGDGQSKSRPSVRSGRKRVVSEGRQQYSDIHIYFRKTQKKLNPH